MPATARSRAPLAARTAAALEMTVASSKSGNARPRRRAWPRPAPAPASSRPRPARCRSARPTRKPERHPSDASPPAVPGAGRSPWLRGDPAWGMPRRSGCGQHRQHAWPSAARNGILGALVQPSTSRGREADAHTPLEAGEHPWYASAALMAVYGLAAAGRLTNSAGLPLGGRGRRQQRGARAPLAVISRPGTGSRGQRRGTCRSTLVGSN
jgi:hypothetical protein